MTQIYTTLKEFFRTYTTIPCHDYTVETLRGQLNVKTELTGKTFLIITMSNPPTQGNRTLFTELVKRVWDISNCVNGIICITNADPVTADAVNKEIGHEKIDMWSDTNGALIRDWGLYEPYGSCKQIAAEVNNCFLSWYKEEQNPADCIQTHPASILEYLEASY